MGKRHSLKNGKVSFCYSSFLGYKKGADGAPEIVPEEAEIIRRIYSEYLMGKTLLMIADELTKDGILTPRKTAKWTAGVIKSILTNEKYKGDALLQKTFVVDCISKKTKKNNGELPMYYVENSHPAIIERSIFDKVQAEMARRSSKPKTREVGTKTELGKYSGKYALSEILYCGECGKPYRRVTWTIRGKRKIVWRCVSRLDYGKKYCKCSPSIEETVLHGAIAEAITRKAQNEGASTDRILQHIEMYQAQQDTSSILAKQERLRELQKKFDDLTNIDIEQADTGEFDEQFESLMTEIHTIEDELSEIERQKTHLERTPQQLEEITTILDGFKNHPVQYDDLVTRQLIHYIKVVSADKLQIYFKDGTIIDADI